MAQILKFENKTKRDIEIQESYSRSEQLNDHLRSVCNRLRWLKANGKQPNDSLAEEYLTTLLAMSDEEDFRDSFFKKH